MSEFWPILLFAAVALAIIAFGALAEARRRKALAEWARRQGFSFNPGGGDAYLAPLDGYTPFGQGHSRRASNAIEGARGALRWVMFDYRYTTGSGKNRSTHRYGVVAAHVGLAFPRTSIRPEGWFDKLASLAGFDDINFESEAFSRRYHVSGQDRRRIYDLLHPRMMEYLMTLPAVHWQLGPGLVLQTRSGRYEPPELERCMGMIEGFLGRVPGYVRDELAG